MKRKIAICLVTLLVFLVATPIQTHALYGGTPPLNTISIDTGVETSTVILNFNEPVYIVNRMSGFSGKTITRVWAYLSPTSESTIENLTLYIFADEPSPAGLALPLVEQTVSIPEYLNVGWFSFDLDEPLLVSEDTDTLYVGFRQNPNMPYTIGYYVDNSTDGGTNSVIGRTLDQTMWNIFNITYNLMIRAEYQVIFAITVTPSDHGTITSSVDSEEAGKEVELNVAPDEGYRLVDNSLKFNGNSITGDYFTMPAEDVVVTGEFEKIPHDVGIMPLDHGTIESDRATAGWGDTVTLTITPDAGYRLVAGSLLYNSDVLINPEFEMPNTDVLIHANFEMIPFEISVEADSNGSFGSDKVNALPGEIVSVTITPKAGYRLVAGSLKYNGITIEGTTFTMPAASVTITGDFELINQIPNTGDVVNSNTVSMMMILGFVLVLGSMSDKKKRNQK